MKKVWIVVAAWVWWTAVAGAARVWPLVVEDEYTLRYEVVSFTLAGSTRESYSEFMGALRRQLATDDVRFGIPVMRAPSTVPVPQQYLLVELSNWAKESVTLAVDVTNAYVVAYQAGDRSYFLGDAPASARPNLFPGTVKSTLAFNGSYPSLQRAAGENRENINLGLTELGAAITSLLFPGTTLKSIASALIVAIQMVSEAARFRYIELRVRQSITKGGEYQTFRPDASMLSLENNWGALSSAVQKSKDGVLSDAVLLQKPDFTILKVDSVTPFLVTDLKFMVFVCERPASQFSPLIRSVVAVDDDETCAIPEPTVRISGRNALCVDVRNGAYNNGNPIQLSACKSNADPNQLWTLKRDGTIRSNGKCLTTNGNSPGVYVMINDCPPAVTAATRWQLVWDNGGIINPQSALALSAEAGNDGTTLTVQTNIYATGQGWVAGNNTQPFVTSIVGFQDLCMQANGDALWLEECASNKAQQQWALYPDGSIRPQQNQDRCLTCSKDTQGTIVNIVACSLGSSGQRWVFRNDGTILNPNNRLVMEVKASNPSLRQIIINPSTGNPNQKWLPML